jgi:hypothetical protein
MNFKEFIHFDEEQSGSDKGLMGASLPPFVRKPSDGRPFKNLGSFAGATPRGGSAASSAGSPMMMRKTMKKN